MEPAAAIFRPMATVVSRIAAIPPTASMPADLPNGRTIARP